MLRNGAMRMALRSMAAPAARPAASFPRTSPVIQQWTTHFGSLASKRPLLPQVSHLKPVRTAILRRNVTKKQHEAEEKYAQEKLEAHPELVSSTSSTNAMSRTLAAKSDEQDVDMMAGMKHDLV